MKRMMIRICSKSKREVVTIIMKAVHSEVSAKMAIAYKRIVSNCYKSDRVRKPISYMATTL